MKNFTIAKSRKKIQITVNEGDYFILVQPNLAYEKHIAAYRTLAESGVNDDVSEVSLSVPRFTNPPLVLMTKAQKDESVKREQTRLESVDNIIGSAKDRQKEMEYEHKAALLKDHKARLDMKNAQIEEIRKNTGQASAEQARLDSEKKLKDEAQKESDRIIEQELLAEQEAERIAAEKKAPKKK